MGGGWRHTQATLPPGMIRYPRTGGRVSPTAPMHGSGKFQYLRPINISRKWMQWIEGGERPRTDKYRENMHDRNCDRSCTLTSLPVWHSVIKIIYRNTRLISITFNSQLPLPSPYEFEKFSPEFHTSLSRHSTSDRTGLAIQPHWPCRKYAFVVVIRDNLKFGNAWSLKICGCRTTPPRLVPLHEQPKMLSYCTVVYRKLSPRTSRQTC